MSEYEQALVRFVAATREYTDEMRALAKAAPHVQAPEYNSAASEAVRGARSVLLEALNEMPHMRAVLSVPVL